MTVGPDAMCLEPALRDASLPRVLWGTWQRGGTSNTFAWHVDSHREVQDVCLPWVTCGRQPSSRRSLGFNWVAVCDAGRPPVSCSRMLTFFSPRLRSSGDVIRATEIASLSVVTCKAPGTRGQDKVRGNMAVCSSVAVGFAAVVCRRSSLPGCAAAAMGFGCSRDSSGNSY